MASSSKKMVKADSATAQPPKPFKCLCKAQFRLAASLQMHLKRKHNIIWKQKNGKPKGVVCPECNKVFQIPSQLKTHLEEAHSEEPLYPCDVCEQRFKSKRSLVAHKKRVHKTEPPAAPAPNRRPRPRPSPPAAAPGQGQPGSAEAWEPEEADADTDAAREADLDWSPSPPPAAPEQGHPSSAEAPEPEEVYADADGVPLPAVSYSESPSSSRGRPGSGRPDGLRLGRIVTWVATPDYVRSRIERMFENGNNGGGSVGATD